MAEIPIISVDSQLEKYGIFTQSTGQPYRTVGRQDFRTVQESDLDIFPSDDVFIAALLAAIELGEGVVLSDGWATTQPDKYIKARRPSMFDFMIDVEVLGDILRKSRYRNNALTHGSEKEYKHKITVVQLALARSCIKAAMSLQEFEEPVCLSGSVYMQPPWRRRDIATDPFVIGLKEFVHHHNRLKLPHNMAETAFRAIALELLDEASAESPDSHKFIREFLKSRRYIEKAPGIITFDTVAAYNLFFERQHQKLLRGHEADSDSMFAQQEETIRELLLEVLSHHIPHGWFTRDGRFNPPRKPSQFDF